MPEQGCRKRQYAPWLMAGVAGVGLLTWVVSTSFVRDGSRSRSITIRATPSGASPSPVPAIRPAEVRMALLFDCYEHGIEHAPPRDPSGVMQRRDRHYTPGPNPFALLRSQLTSRAEDVSARRWLDGWEATWRRSGSTDAGHVDELDRILPHTSLSSDTLLRAGVAFNFLDGDEHAARWYRAGLAKAETEYAGVTPADPRVRPLLALLDQTRALWRIHDHAAMEKRFALAKSLNPPLSPEARRAGYLHAEMLYYQRRYHAAADAMAAVQAEHERAGDLGAREKSDLEEMHWVHGLLLSGAGRHAQALPHLEEIAAAGGERAKQALYLLYDAQFQLGDFDRAFQTYEQWEKQQYAAGH